MARQLRIGRGAVICILRRPDKFDSERSMPIQRLKELRRRRTRRKKVAKLRQRYAAARSEAERAAILEKLSKVAPGFTL